MRNETTHHHIWTLITNEIRGQEREEVLKHLALAFVTAWEDENDGEMLPDHEYMDENAAHRAFVDAYYTAAKPDTRTDPNTYLGSNPSEVSIPDWCPNQRRILRKLAKHERMRDEAMKTWARANMKQPEAK